jgi:hypothetical protein
VKRTDGFQPAIGIAKKDDLLMLVEIFGIIYHLMTFLSFRIADCSGMRL